MVHVFKGLGPLQTVYVEELIHKPIQRSSICWRETQICLEVRREFEKGWLNIQKSDQSVNEMGRESKCKLRIVIGQMLIGVLRLRLAEQMEKRCKLVGACCWIVGPWVRKEQKGIVVMRTWKEVVVWTERVAGWLVLLLLLGWLRSRLLRRRRRR